MWVGLVWGRPEGFGVIHVMYVSVVVLKIVVFEGWTGRGDTMTWNIVPPLVVVKVVPCVIRKLAASTGVFDMIFSCLDTAREPVVSGLPDTAGV